MANTPTKTQSGAALHEGRMRSAVQAIADSEDLRYFMRQLLMECGDHLTPDGGNAIETAKMIGRHSIGKELIATMIKYDPTLYPKLILEDLTAQADEGETYAVD